MGANETKWQRTLREVTESQLLSREEEEHLVGLGKKGDKAAADRLVAAHSRYALRVASVYSRQYAMPVEVLFEEAQKAVPSAIENFKPEHGRRFAAYAIDWMRATIGRYVMTSLHRGSA